MAARHLDLCGLFTIAERNGSYVFGPGSYPSGHPNATQPGTVYHLPPAEVSLAFAGRLPCVSSLTTDEFGHSITAFVPVLDPNSGKAVFLLAADMKLPVLRRRLVKVCGTSIALTLATIILLGMLWLLANGRMPLPRVARQHRQHVETFLCALILLQLTGSITLHLYVAESQARTRALLAAAQQQTALISSELEAVSRGLDCIAHVFQASETVTRSEFSLFVAHVIRNCSIQAVTWAPAVRRDEVESFEKAARASGMHGYRVWRNAETNHLNVTDGASDILYPIYYATPLTRHEDVLGFDQMSAPIRREAILRALATASPSATRLEPIITS